MGICSLFSNDSTRTIDYREQRCAANTDASNTTLQGFLSAQQFLAHPTLCILHIIIQAISRDTVDQGCCVVMISQQASHIGHDHQGRSVQGSGDCGSSTITINIQTLALMTEG